jgi:hypothetical protein
MESKTKHLISTAFFIFERALPLGGKRFWDDCSGFTQMVYKLNGTNY